MRVLQSVVDENQRLSRQQKELLQNFGKVYISTVDVHATQLDRSLSWNTDHGSTLWGQPGDWLVETDGERWTVDGEVFQRTYEHLEADVYRKVTPVLAAKLAHPDSVESREGVVNAERGDLLVCNITGECWSVPACRFFQRYAPLNP